MEKEAIVLYPAPPVGHLVSMVELGKLILTHHPTLAVHVIIAPSSYRAESTAPYISAVSAAAPSIIFHHLPYIPPYSTTPSSAHHHESLTLEALCASNPHVHRTLHAISAGDGHATTAIRAVIIDLFCAAALDVIAEFDIPAYFFFTSGAACLATFLHLPVLHAATTENFKDVEGFLRIPGVPPFRGSDMPTPLLERQDEIYECFVDFTKRMQGSAGIIVNTFDALEPRPLKAISDGLCVPDRPTPPVYPIGPITSAGTGVHKGAGFDCLRWLETQPSESVVFLCFGSLGVFGKEQLSEIAIGLERSGVRFLWVLRNPPANEEKKVAIEEQREPDLETLLPEGFVERTKERGMVVKSWAPQIAVLSHDSVGGFVTHCGWNSILEAVIAGVPMVAWPLYAEQRLNRVLMVDEIKIGLPMTESENGFVSSAEVEKRLKQLMDGQEGESVRRRAKAMKEAAAAAFSPGGSSLAAITTLLSSWKQ